MQSESSRRLARRLDALFGSGIDWRRETGVVHVTAIGEPSRAVLAIGPDAPRSATDRFVLGFARARADVIVTTGAILRAEPRLVHDTAEDPGEAAAWARWRAEVLARREAPVLLVLSASGALDLAHPALRAAPRTIVWTTASGRERLGAVDPERVEIVVPCPHSGADRSPEHGADADANGAAQAALEAALRGLRAGAALGGDGTIVIEAGPRATAGLYACPHSAGAVDELLLGIYAGGGCGAVAGPRMAPTDRLADGFGAGPRSSRWVEEPSGAWRFERYRRERADRADRSA